MHKKAVFLRALSGQIIRIIWHSKKIGFCQPIENCIFASKSPFLVCCGHFGYRSKFAAIRHNLTEPRRFSQWKCRKLAAETQFWVKNTKRLDRANKNDSSRDSAKKMSPFFSVGRQWLFASSRGTSRRELHPFACGGTGTRPAIHSEKVFA